jgi:arylsulfatase A-like enzyme
MGAERQPSLYAALRAIATLTLAAVRPNILCVVFDTARADALEPYGAPPGSTPAVEQLARRGRALPGVHATACWTLPSHGSMFTGLLPRAARIGETGAQRSETAAILKAQRDRVLPEVLRRAGYSTGAVSANVWVSEWTGFDTGFDRFVLTDSGRQGRIHAEDARSRARWAREAVRARVDDGASEAERILGGWIDELDRQRPFFWFVNLVECHSPYLPPRPYNDLGPIQRLRAGVEAQRHLTLGEIWRACVANFDVPRAALDRMRHLYMRSVRYMDDWLGRLLERLDAAGVLDDTVVMVLSDHGENLGEGGLIAHAFSLDDRLIHVPLIAAGPGTERMPEGMKTLAELPRAVAQVAELSDHPWLGDDLGPDGIAVAQLNPPVTVDHPNVQRVREEWRLDDDGLRRLTTPFVCATDGRFKLIARAGREELIDLGADPLELDPVPVGSASLSPDAEAVLPSLREALAHPSATATGPIATTESQVPTPTAEETEDIEERMRLLGYM